MPHHAAMDVGERKRMGGDGRTEGATGRGLGKGGAKRHLKVLRNKIQGITKLARFLMILFSFSVTVSRQGITWPGGVA
jgi:hypothetical protein